MPAVQQTLTLGLLTKYGDAGQVKTRLGSSIGMRRAAALHRQFVAHLCSSLSNAADRRIISLAPDDRLPEFQQDLREWGLEAQWSLIAQGLGSLGDRMQRCFHQFLAGNATTAAILIGADCPLLGESQIRRAADQLRSHDVVLGPAVDGGYYLIGLRGPWRPGLSQHEILFRDIPWSTPQVLAITRQRAVQAGFTVAEIEPMEDVDTIDELNRFRRILEETPAGELKSKVDEILQDFSHPDRCDP